MSTYVILCYMQYVDDESPTTILGPFTKTAAERTAKRLTCRTEVRSITTIPPEWTLS